MKDKVFINRKKDLNEFKTLLNITEDNKNSIIILHANSGFGKSSFTNKLLEDTKDYIAIKISLPSSSYSSEEFIKQIAIQMDFLSDENNKLLSMEAFIKNEMSKGSENHYNSKLLDTLLNTPGLKIFKSLKLIIDKNLANGIYSTNSILSNPNDSMIYISEYIEKNLSLNKIFLVIENIQCIDKVSLNLLSKIIQNTYENKIILEYTDDSKNKNFEIYDIENAFNKKNSDVKKKELKELSLKELIEHFIDKNREKEYDAFVKKLYVGYDGNLRRFEDLIAYYNDTDKNIDYNKNPTISRVQQLSKTLQFIICLIVAHRSNININVLRYLYEFEQTIQNEIFDLDIELSKIEDDFILFNNNQVLIKHDYIKDEILNNEYFNRYLIIGYQMWSDYYYNLYVNKNFTNITMQDLSNNLFYFFYKSDSKKVFTIFDDIKKIAINSIYPDDATLYLEKIRNNITDNNSFEYRLINYALFDIYYYLGIFEKCYEIISNIKEETLKKEIYYIATLDRLDRHLESIEKIDKILDKNPNLNYLLVLNILKMTSLRSLNKIEEAKKIFFTCLKNDNFKELYEYGFLLRNSEIFLSYEKSIIYLNESVEFFEKRCIPIYEGHSRVSLAMNYARIGKLDKALEEINIAEKLLSNETIEKFIYLVDKSIILLYINFEENINIAINLLKKALRFSTTNFDKIAIYNNLLICYAYLKEENNAFEIIDILNNLISAQPDVVAHRITYFNISYLYKQLNNEDYYKKYLEKAKEIKSIDDIDFWNVKLLNTSITDDQYKFLLKFDFDLFYLSYWHFDISQIQ